MTVWFDEARGRWRYNFMIAGVRYARECVDAAGVPVTSRRAAIEAEAEAKRIAKIAPKLPRANDLTVAQVYDRLTDDWVKEADWPNKKRYVREILDFFKPETAVRDIDEAKLADFRTHLASQPLMIWTGGALRQRTAPDAERFWKPHPSGKLRGAATVNRYMPAVRAMFDRAWKTRDPITRARAIEEVPKIEDLPELKRKPRPVPEAVIAELEQLLPDYTVEAMITTCYFGSRKTEAFTLQIANVDFDARGIRLMAEHVKDDEDAFTPGGTDAMAWLEFLCRQAKARGTKFLITRPGRIVNAAGVKIAAWVPVKSPKTAFNNAMDVIEQRHGRRWRWHDIRAAWITHIAMKAGPIVAQKLARHSDFATTQAYIDVADQALRDAVDTVSARPALTIVKGGRR